MGDKVSDGDESMAASNVNDSDADESMEEAPYAYDGRTNITNVDVMEVDAESPKKTERREDDQEGDCRAKKSRRGSGLPHTTSHSESKAIDSNSYDNGFFGRHDPTPSSVTRAEGKIPDSPTSEDEFTMGAPHAGTDEGDQDSPIQLMHWLARFNGRPVEVDTNGQCAMLAMHATTLNYDGQVLPKSAKITKGANKLKRLTYTIMMANLRKDVELGLVDPVRELKQLHPDRTITSLMGWLAQQRFCLRITPKNEIDP
ncbi:hypothetical protein PHMEG_00027302 [Phytophthora megakarya]|uniref:Uncharacterized protein n=1 Tax=Phytophthora megakarya TaxID=4795 RepID=A0A225V8A0_9STRA|nr:hypothetical protein PHMEG_00027302 [Phytophthora megakarya]